MLQAKTRSNESSLVVRMSVTSVDDHENELGRGKIHVSEPENVFICTSRKNEWEGWVSCLISTMIHQYSKSCNFS